MRTRNVSPYENGSNEERICLNMTGARGADVGQMSPWFCQVPISCCSLPPGEAKRCRRDSESDGP